MKCHQLLKSKKNVCHKVGHKIRMTFILDMSLEWCCSTILLSEISYRNNSNVTELCVFTPANSITSGYS